MAASSRHADSLRSTVLAPGKLPHPLLQRMLGRLHAKTPGVVLGPQVGIDAAVVRSPGRYVAVTSDPITLAGDLAAYYCVHVNANDLAVMGAVPKYMIVVALFPPVPAGVVEKTARDLARFARALDIAIIGGHTEITTTVNTPILIATMFGPLARGGKRLVSAASAKPGDVVVMTKFAALEAAAILARDKAAILARKGFDPPTIRKMQKFLFRPGLSIVPEARLALAAGCSAMHDATEGGILTALWELAAASKVRIEIEMERIPVPADVIHACRIWNIDPLRVISSGALLVTISAARSPRLLENLRRAGIRAAVIGRVRSGRPALIDVASGQSLGPSEDEITKV